MKASLLMSAVVLGALLSVPAAAQFTAVVAPPKPKPVAVAAAGTPAVVAVRDSAARVTMTNMKDWVDSAAASLGVALSPVAADSLGRPAAANPPLSVPTRPDSVLPARATRGTTEFREGAAAPDTATPLPMLALLGGFLLTTGLWLLRRKTCVGSSAQP